MNASVYSVYSIMHRGNCNCVSGGYTLDSSYAGDQCSICDEAFGFNIPIAWDEGRLRAHLGCRIEHAPATDVPVPREGVRVLALRAISPLVVNPPSCTTTRCCEAGDVGHAGNCRTSRDGYAITPERARELAEEYGGFGLDLSPPLDREVGAFLHAFVDTLEGRPAPVSTQDETLPAAQNLIDDIHRLLDLEPNDDPALRGFMVRCEVENLKTASEERDATIARLKRHRQLIRHQWRAAVRAHKRDVETARVLFVALAEMGQTALAASEARVAKFEQNATSDAKTEREYRALIDRQDRENAALLAVIRETVERCEAARRGQPSPATFTATERSWMRGYAKFAEELLPSLRSALEGAETYADPSLRERLAALCHEQWSGWMRYMYGDCTGDVCRSLGGPAGDRPEPRIEHYEYRQRWLRQMETPYADLSEVEKESDRKEADRIIAVLASVMSQPRPAGAAAHKNGTCAAEVTYDSTQPETQHSGERSTTTAACGRVLPCSLHANASLCGAPRTAPPPSTSPVCHRGKSLLDHHPDQCSSGCDRCSGSSNTYRTIGELLEVPRMTDTDRLKQILACAWAYDDKPHLLYRAITYASEAVDTPNVSKEVARLMSNASEEHSEILRLCGPTCPHDGKRAAEHRTYFIDRCVATTADGRCHWSAESHRNGAVTDHLFLGDRAYAATHPLWPEGSAWLRAGRS